MWGSEVIRMQDLTLREVEVGVVTHYWSHLGVAGVHLEVALDVGDHIHVLGHTSDFEQDIGSMELDHHAIEHAAAGMDVGLRVAEHTRAHDRVFKLVPSSDIGEGGTLI
jgi:hypothetical protein